jgi:hypothetical protein
MLFYQSFFSDAHFINHSKPCKQILQVDSQLKWLNVVQVRRLGSTKQSRAVSRGSASCCATEKRCCRFLCRFHDGNVSTDQYRSLSLFLGEPKEGSLVGKTAVSDGHFTSTWTLLITNSNRDLNIFSEVSDLKVYEFIIHILLLTDETSISLCL